jgi:MFS family permease
MAKRPVATRPSVLLVAIGFACLFTPLTALTGMWFNARKGLAIGIVTAGGAFGQGIVPYLGRMLITTLGWRDAMLVIGAGFFVILIPLMFLLRPAPIEAQPPGQAAPRDTNLWNLPHTVTLPWLGFAALFCCICMAVPQVHLVPLGIDLGCSPQTAAGLLLTVMVTAVFGRLFFGWPPIGSAACRPISWRRWRKPPSCSGSPRPKALPRCFNCRCCSASAAGVMTCLLICAREAAPLRLSAFAMAAVATVGWLGMGFGSYQAGFFYDISANYRLSFANATGAGVLNLLIVAALFWYRRERSARRRFALERT